MSIEDQSIINGVQFDTLMCNVKYIRFRIRIIQEAYGEIFEMRELELHHPNIVSWNFDEKDEDVAFENMKVQITQWRAVLAFFEQKYLLILQIQENNRAELTRQTERKLKAYLEMEELDIMEFTKKLRFLKCNK